MLTNLVPKGINESWKPFLQNEVLFLLTKIEDFIKSNEEEVTPKIDRILQFMTTDLTRVKVVIIGQDPYPQPGIATGRAFEVGNLQRWEEPFKNASLRNIIRSIYSAYTGEIKTFNEIKEKMKPPGSFKLLPPNRLFKHWESQGVLLLNTSFTCRPGNPGSHTALWRTFTTQLLSYVNQTNPNAVWFLWGNHAQKALGLFQPKNTLITTHPMICSQRENDFLFGKKNVFYETMHLIDWTGYN